MISEEENKKLSGKEVSAFFWLAVEILLICLIFAVSSSIRTCYVSEALPSAPPPSKILLFLGEAASRAPLDNPFAVFPLYFIFIFLIPVFIKDRLRRMKILHTIIILLAVFIISGFCVLLIK